MRPAARDSQPLQAKNFDCETTALLTTYRSCDRHFASSLLRGVSGDDPAGGARSGVRWLRREPQPPEVRDPVRQASGLARASHWRLRCPTAGDGSVGPRPKIATVERREGSRSQRDGAAPQRRGGRASHARREETSAPVGAPPPLIRGPDRPLSPRLRAQTRRSVGDGSGDRGGDTRQGKATTRAHERAAGTKKTALFDIVSSVPAVASQCGTVSASTRAASSLRSSAQIAAISGATS